MFWGVYGCGLGFWTGLRCECFYDTGGFRVI